MRERIGGEEERTTRRSVEQKYRNAQRGRAFLLMRREMRRVSRHVKLSTWYRGNKNKKKKRNEKSALGWERTTGTLVARGMPSRSLKLSSARKFDFFVLTLSNIGRYYEHGNDMRDVISNKRYILPVSRALNLLSTLTKNVSLVSYNFTSENDMCVCCCRKKREKKTGNDPLT